MFLIMSLQSDISYCRVENKNVAQDFDNSSAKTTQDFYDSTDGVQASCGPKRHVVKINLYYIIRGETNA